MTEYNWKGWEYESWDGLHMIMSKRHIFPAYSNQAVCGVIAPKPGASVAEGDTPCKKCQRWEDKQAKQLNKSN